MKSNPKSNQLSSQQIYFSPRENQFSTVLFTYYAVTDIFRNIEQISGVRDQICLNRSWSFEEESCWLLHKIGLNNPELPPFQGGRNGFPWSYPWCSSQGIIFQTALQAQVCPTSKYFQDIKLLCESCCDYFLTWCLCFSYPEAFQCKLILPALLPTCFSLSLQPYLLMNLHTRLCSWLDLHQSRHIALPETAAALLTLRVNSK